MDREIIEISNPNQLPKDKELYLFDDKKSFDAATIKGTAYRFYQQYPIPHYIYYIEKEEQ